MGDGSYDLEYLEAVLCEDFEEIDRIEAAAEALGYGPLVQCTTVTNCSSQRAFCRKNFAFSETENHAEQIIAHDHRNSDSILNQPLMVNIACSSKIRMFEPEEDFRSDCPFILVVAKHPHTHPVPLPTKTPPIIRTQLFKILESLGEDLPDITPRRLIRHPVIKAFLKAELPQSTCPTLESRAGQESATRGPLHTPHR